jgi:4-diphosphocytidyl-2-C-methyl-D-erythritol kinase
MSVHRQLAAAKLNLTLAVLGRRADGYHELESLVAFADIGDEVTLDTTLPVEVATSGPFAASIAGANLIAVTLQRIAQIAPQVRLGRVTLVKRLPVAAGIGGGSADAAAVIRAARAANPQLAAEIDWPALALSLGADVPVCLASTASWMRGVGERVEPIEGGLPPLDVVIVNPRVAVPADKTAAVFRRLGARALSKSGPECSVVGRLGTREEVLAVMRAVGNDLTEAARAVVPAVGEVLARLGDLDGVVYTALSGGGPTCFGVLGSRAEAEAAARAILSAEPGWWAVAATLR